MFDYVFFTDATDTVLIYKPIGVYKIAHELRRLGRRCLVVDHLHCWSESELKSLIDQTCDSNTRAVGFSNTFFQDINNSEQPDGSVIFGPFNQDRLFPQGQDFEERILDYLKQKNPKLSVIVGGAQSRPDFTNRNADFVVLGYGESAICDIDDYLYSAQPIPNSRRNLWGVTIIDDKTANRYDFAASDFAWQPTDVVNHKVLDIEIARGCIFKCKFCSYPMIGKKNLDFMRSSRTLSEEMQNNYDVYGIKDYYILDDTFNDNDHKLQSILTSVKKLNFQPRFWSYCRLDLLTTRKHVDVLYDIGLRSIYFGIETLHPAAAKAIGKGFDRSRQIDTIRHIRQRYPDVTMHGSFIVGLPGEDIASVTDTFNRCYQQDIPLHTYVFKPLAIRKPEFTSWSSEIEKDFAKFGYSALRDTPTKKIMVWENAHMNYDIASEIAESWNNQARSNSAFMIPGQVQWGLKNYGLDSQYLTSTSYRDLDWHHISGLKQKFVQEYKTQLLNLVGRIS